MNQIAPGLIAYALVVAALLCLARMSWGVYKNAGGGTRELALSCVCAGMVLFMTVVPYAIYVAVPHQSMSVKITLEDL